jgi:hypothetical protein
MSKTKRKREQTDNRGAADERACILRKVRCRRSFVRLKVPSSLGNYRDGWNAALRDIEDFITFRSARFRKRKGGL